MNSNQNVSIYDSISELSKETKVRLIKEMKKNLSLNLSEITTKEISKTEQDNELYNSSQDESFISDTLLEESFLVKLWVAILGFLQRGKSIEDIYKVYLLKKIENEVNSTYKRPIIDFKKEIFQAGFLEMILSIYLPIIQLRDFFNMLEKGNVAIEQTMFEFIQDKVPNSKYEIQNFLDLKIYESYLKKERQQRDLEDSIKEKIDLYIETIPLNTYKTVEDKFGFYYVLNSLAFFPYKSLFSFFNVDLFEDDESLDKINLSGVHEANFLSISKYINYLFDILYTLNTLEIDEDLLREIIKNYFIATNSQNNSENSDEINTKIESVLTKVLLLIKKIIVLPKNLPYIDIFKLYHKNLIAKPKKYIPYFEVKGFYENILFLNTHAQVVKECKQTLMNLLNKEIAYLFKNFSEVLDINNKLFKDLGFEYNFRKLYFLSEFFKNTYDIKMVEVLKTINNVVLINNFELRNVYINIENNINNLKKEVHDIRFEINYKNEEYDKLRKDNKIDQSYKEQIDRWCSNEILVIDVSISKFLDYFIILKKSYNSLLENYNTFIQNSLSISYKIGTTEGEKITLIDVIKNMIVIIDKAIFVLENL